MSKKKWTEDSKEKVLKRLEALLSRRDKEPYELRALDVKALGLTRAVETLFRPKAMTKLKKALQDRKDCRLVELSRTSATSNEIYETPEDIPYYKAGIAALDAAGFKIKDRKKSLRNARRYDNSNAFDSRLEKNLERIRKGAEKENDYKEALNRFLAVYKNRISAAETRLHKKQANVFVAIEKAEVKTAIIKDYIERIKLFKKQHGVFPALRGPYQYLYRLISSPEAGAAEIITVMSWYAPIDKDWQKWLDELKKKYC